MPVHKRQFRSYQQAPGLEAHITAHKYASILDCLSIGNSTAISLTRVHIERYSLDDFAQTLLNQFITSHLQIRNRIEAEVVFARCFKCSTKAGKTLCANVCIDERYRLGSFGGKGGRVWSPPEKGREPRSIQAVYTARYLQDAHYIAVYISCEIQGLVVESLQLWPPQRTPRT